MISFLLNVDYFIDISGILHYFSGFFLVSKAQVPV